MACFESGTVISLPRREAITLPGVRGATLRVSRGNLWVTEERAHRNNEDIVLRPGDSWLVESNGDTVVEAQNDALFCISGTDGSAVRLPAPAQRRVGLLAALAGLIAGAQSARVR